MDGFNDNDLKYLQKGYKIDDVFAVADYLCQYGIPTLMYAILTTLETDYPDLFDTLQNMLKLALKGGIYIGPTITPSIYVNNNNKKLYPKFLNDDFAYLEVESLRKTFQEEDNVHEMVLAARILPRDRIVRKVVLEIGNPTSMESAYILPVLNVYFRCLAKEVNFLKRVLKNIQSLSRSLDRAMQKHQERLDIAKRHNKSMYNDDSSIFIINYINSQSRKLNDISEYKLLLSDKKLVEERLQSIKEILQRYTDFYFNENKNSNPNPSGQLCDSIRRLLAFPIIVFKEHLDAHSREEFPLFAGVTLDDLQIYDDEVEIFRRLI